MTKRMLMVLGALTLASSVACAGGAPVETQLGIRVVYVERRPPVQRVEVIGVAPGPEYVWVNGYWGWSGVEYVWVSGRWAMPPQRYAVWVPGRWERARGHGYYYAEGHWKGRDDDRRGRGRGHER